MVNPYIWHAKSSEAEELPSYLSTTMWHLPFCLPRSLPAFFLTVSTLGTFLLIEAGTYTHLTPSHFKTCPNTDPLALYPRASSS